MLVSAPAVTRLGEAFTGARRRTERVGDAIEVGLVEIAQRRVRGKQFDVSADHGPGQADQPGGPRCRGVRNEIKAFRQRVLQRPGRTAVDPFLQAAVTEAALLGVAAVGDVKNIRGGEEKIFRAEMDGRVDSAGVDRVLLRGAQRDGAVDAAQRRADGRRSRQRRAVGLDVRCPARALRAVARDIKHAVDDFHRSRVGAGVDRGGAAGAILGREHALGVVTLHALARDVERGAVDCRDAARVVCIVDIVDRCTCIDCAVVADVGDDAGHRGVFPTRHACRLREGSIPVNRGAAFVVGLGVDAIAHDDQRLTVRRKLQRSLR